jgi:putative ABC transport system ATP-binding protein
MSHVDAMVRITNLEFHYPQSTFRIHLSDFVVAPGERIAILGPSGSGKTTLLHLIAGIQTPHSGEIEVAGKSLIKLSDSARREFRLKELGLVFQNFALVEHLNLLDNMLLPYRIGSVLTLDSQVRDRAVQLAKQLGIGDYLKRTVGKLSQGEKQRLAMARALLPNPKLILADEPTGNLDPDNKAHLLELLFDTVTANHATLIMVTHDHERLDRFDRVVHFKDLIR